MAEWNWDKNNALGLIPQNLTCGQHKKVWWKCKYGHEWEASIYNRSSGHTNCPICSKELHTSFREQAVFYYLSRHFKCQNRAIIDNYEIDIFIPDINIGIEYDGRYYHPKSKENNEKKKDDYFRNIGIQIIRIKEDSINLIEQNCIHYIYSSSTFHQLNWAITELLRMFYIEENVDVNNDQVDIISQYIQSVKENSLKMKYPELAKEWDIDANKGITSEMISAGSHKKVFWRCEKNHLYRASVNERVRYYKQDRLFGCPYCSGHKVLPGYNDLQTTNPNLAKEWDHLNNGDITPRDVVAGSSKKYWWKCHNCGNVWLASVKNRINGRGCPVCKSITISNKLIKRATKEKTFADEFPSLVCEWDSCNVIKPTEIAPHSNIKVWWICSKCGHKWITSVNNRANGYGCKECYLRNRVISNIQAIICIETMETFESISSASQKMKISKSSICNCLKGRAKTAGGYHWKYANS